MSEYEPSGRKSLEIRGHHLKSFARLFVYLNHDGQLRRSVEEFGSSKEIDRAINAAIDNEIRIVGKEDTGVVLPEGYKEDVLGSTSEELKIFRKKHQKVYLDFLTLPDDYPVKILTNELDDICRACVIGRHCTSTLNKDSGYDVIEMQSYLGISTRSGSILPLKRLRWSLSTYAHHYSYLLDVLD